MLEKLIRILKRDPNYRWNQKYNTRDLLIITIERGLQLVRGSFLRLFIKRGAGFLFVGKRVKLKHGNHVTFGENFILSDNVYINALSIQGVNIGKNVSIGRNATLICTGVISNIGIGITIGDGVGINSEVYIGGQGGVTIGDNTIIGPGVRIFSENHNFSNPDVLIKKQGETRKEVIIGQNCWIGSGAHILAGVSIGSGNVVAAGSVVTKSFGDNNIIGGTPARVLKNRIIS